MGTHIRTYCVSYIHVTPCVHVQCMHHKAHGMSPGSRVCDLTCTYLRLFRDMDEAVSILKECGEFMTQAASTVPHSMKMAQGTGRLASDGGGTRGVGGDGDAGDGRGGKVPTSNRDMSDSSKPKVRNKLDCFC